MKIISAIEEKYSNFLKDKNILVYTHTTDATTVFLRTMSNLGARLFYIPISYSKNQIFIEQISQISNLEIIKTQMLPQIIPRVDAIVEDGMRISKIICKNPERFKPKKSFFSIEQTTSGIRKFEKSDLLYPVINAAESELKLRIENNLATPESVLTSLLLESDTSLTQKNILVLGYGNVGSGIAKLCNAHGGNITISDSDSMKRTFAISHGFRAVNNANINETIKTQDIIISCTSNTEGFCLGVEQFLLMKDGTKIINAGSSRGEISPELLNVGEFERNRAKINIKQSNDHLYCTFTKMELKKHVIILGSAHPINLRCGSGTSKDAMDFVFSIILLILIKTDPEKLTAGIHTVSKHIQKEVSMISEPDLYTLQPELIQNEKLNADSRPWGKLFRFTSKQDLKNFSVVRAVFEPNSNTDGHYHAVSEEAYIVESGTANILTWDPQNPHEKTTFNVKSNDYLSIPKGHAHKVIVTSDEKFSCLVIASPPFSFWDQFFPKVPDY